MITWVPRRLGGGAYGIRRELASLREPQIWLAMLISTLSSAALFSVLTFLTPLLEHEAGLTPHEAALALFLFGAGLSVGGLAGGRLADRNALLAIRALLVADVIALVSFGLRSAPARSLSSPFSSGVLLHSPSCRRCSIGSFSKRRRRLILHQR